MAEPLLTKEMAAHCKIQGLSAMSCAKMAESIKIQLGC